MMFQIKNKKHHPKGWCFSELAFRANSPGAEDGTCPPAGGAVVASCETQLGKQSPGLFFNTHPSSPCIYTRNKGTIQKDDAFVWCGRRDLPGCGQSGGRL